MNVESKNRVSTCQPGCENVYSSIYFFLREVKGVFPNEVKEYKVMDDIVKEVLN